MDNASAEAVSVTRVTWVNTAILCVLVKVLATTTSHVRALKIGAEMSAIGLDVRVLQIVPDTEFATVANIFAIVIQDGLAVTAIRRTVQVNRIVTDAVAVWSKQEELFALTAQGRVDANFRFVKLNKPNADELNSFLF